MTAQKYWPMIVVLMMFAWWARATHDVGLVAIITGVWLLMGTVARTPNPPARHNSNEPHRQMTAHVGGVQDERVLSAIGRLLRVRSPNIEGRMP